MNRQEYGFPCLRVAFARKHLHTVSPEAAWACNVDTVLEGLETPQDALERRRYLAAFDIGADMAEAAGPTTDRLIADLQAFLDYYKDKPDSAAAVTGITLYESCETPTQRVLLQR